MTSQEIMRHTRQTIYGLTMQLIDLTNEFLEIEDEDGVPALGVDLLPAMDRAVTNPSYRWWIREQADYYGT